MIRQLRADARLSSLPILVLTAARSWSVNDTIKASADGISNKPVELKSLIAQAGRLMIPSLVIGELAYAAAGGIL